MLLRRRAAPEQPSHCVNATTFLCVFLLLKLGEGERSSIVARPGVLSVGPISSGSFPPALGAETLPRRVPIISTGILTQQLLLRNSDPSLFIRRRPHCGHCFSHELVLLIGRNRKVPNATICFRFSRSLARFFYEPRLPDLLPDVIALKTLSDDDFIPCVRRPLI